MSASQRSQPEHLRTQDDETGAGGVGVLNINNNDDAGLGGVTSAQQQLALPTAGGDNQLTRTEISSPDDVKHTISFDSLGPLVINKDGTLSRIHNWTQMTEPERERTVRILGKRNMLRKEAILKEDEQEHQS